MEPIIRAYIKSDKQSCLKAFKSNVPDYFTEEEIVDFENFLSRIERDAYKTYYYVLIYNDKVIGCGGFGEKDTNKNIISLAWGLIHKAYHKKGFGKKLLLYRIEQIKKLKLNFPITLDTTQYSYGFFEKYGFSTSLITPNFYTIGMHRYDMKLEL